MSTPQQQRNTNKSPSLSPSNATGAYNHHLNILNSNNQDAANPHVEEMPKLTLRETAIDAASRKEHAVNKGYFVDPFLEAFTGDNTYINSPLMNRGYWLRVKAVENAVNRFLEMFPEDPIQIISVGAGYDTLYFRWAAAACSKRDATPGTASGSSFHMPTCPNFGDFARLHRFVEIDHADVIRGKRDIILKQAGMNDLAHLKSDQEVATSEEQRRGSNSEHIYRLVECDLTDTAALVDALLNPARAAQSCILPEDRQNESGHACIDPTMPTLILAECVLVYMSGKDSTKLLETFLTKVFPLTTTTSQTNNNADSATISTTSVGATTTPVLLLSYDAVNPDDRFGKVMVETLLRRGIPLSGIAELKTPAAHEARAKAVGFNCVRSQTMKKLHESVSLEDRKHLDALERIDDWEEWDLLHEHYALTFAGRLSEAEVEKRGGHMPNLFLGYNAAPYLNKVEIHKKKNNQEGDDNDDKATTQD
jgi:hypothetical protein